MTTLEEKKAIRSEMQEQLEKARNEWQQTDEWQRAKKRLETVENREQKIREKIDKLETELVTVTKGREYVHFWTRENNNLTPKFWAALKAAGFKKSMLSNKNIAALANEIYNKEVKLSKRKNKDEIKALNIESKALEKEEDKLDNFFAYEITDRMRVLKTLIGELTDKIRAEQEKQESERIAGIKYDPEKIAERKKKRINMNELAESDKGRKKMLAAYKIKKVKT